MGHIQVVLWVAWVLSVTEEGIIDVQSLENVESLFREIDDGVIVEAFAGVLAEIDDVLVLPGEGVVLQ